MSGGTINVPIVFRGPNGAAAGVAAQHSQVCFCPHCVTLVALAPCNFLLREHKDIGYQVWPLAFSELIFLCYPLSVNPWLSSKWKLDMLEMMHVAF
jgi:hypothetical protein